MAREQATLSRRNLLGGRPGGGRATEDEHHVSGLVVHARPERLAEVLGSLRAMPGLELHAESPAGKVVATLETLSEDEVVRLLGEIGELPGVLSTALVYHRFD